ncbi:hypothetical protein PC128_g25859 [Phytophthora cactorum]|nr:hypothetical protein PC128_g25859 [Phytophthora cactorum]
MPVTAARFCVADACWESCVAVAAGTATCCGIDVVGTTAHAVTSVPSPARVVVDGVALIVVAWYVDGPGAAEAWCDVAAPVRAVCRLFSRKPKSPTVVTSCCIIAIGAVTPSGAGADPAAGVLQLPVRVVVGAGTASGAAAAAVKIHVPVPYPLYPYQYSSSRPPNPSPWSR